MLPQYLPDLRVFSFKYNTRITGSTSMTGIRDYAWDLVFRLLNNREDDEEAYRRPLVFVGHSLGGVIIKRVSAQLHVAFLR